MPTGIDAYKHLDAQDKFSISLSIPELAEKVCEMNYGAQRFLSAMVHELRKKESLRGFVNSRSPLADELEKALNNGLFY